MKHKTLIEEKVYLTTDGLAKIRTDLALMKDVKRPEVVDRLALARSQGDLSENTEYVSARDDLAFLDGRIEELEDLLLKVVIIDESHCQKGCVGLGSKVTVRVNGAAHIYHIVGEWEADPMQMKVSHSSPLGQALLGKTTGQEVEFDAPAGKVIYKIIKVE